MPTRCLSSVAWSVLLALVLSGCPKRPADPAELLAETAEPAALELLRAAGDRALVVALVRPSAWTEGARAAADLLRGQSLPEAERILAQPDLWAAAGELAELALGQRPAGLTGVLPGWDPARPLALALFEPSVDDSVLAARALMLEAAALGTSGLRHRVLIPATDSRALLGGLLEALAPLGLAADSEARALPGLRGGQVLRLPGEEASLLLLVPEARWVRVEILQADTRVFASPEARLEAVAALLAPPPPREGPLTPALLFAASRQELLTLWFRPWWLRDVGGQVGTSKVAQAVRFADPSYRAMLLAAGLAEVSQGYLAMDPRGVEIDDWAWSLGVAPGADAQAGPRVRLASVLSLTEQGARVWARGLEGGARLPAAELPQASLSSWMRLDLAAAVAAAELPPGLADAKDMEELARRVQECGGFCMLHFGLRAPLGLLKALWRFLPADLPIPLPRGLGLAVGSLPAGLATAPAVVAVASLPVGVNLAALERAVGELREAGARAGLGVLWRTEVRPEDTRVWFGLNESAERVFRGPEPAVEDGPAGHGLLGEVRLDLRGLADGLRGEAPEAAAILARLGGLRGWSRLQGRWLQGEAVLGPPAEGEAPAWGAEGAVWAWESPGARAAAGRGAVCLAGVTRGMTEGFRALAAVDPSQKGLVLARAMEEASRQLPCALAEPETEQQARRLQRSLFLAIADLHEGELRQDELARVLAIGCEQGVEEACARKARLSETPRLELPRVETVCGTGLQGWKLARLPAGGATPALPPPGDGPFGLAADRRALAGQALEVLRTLAGPGTRLLVLAVAGDGGNQGVSVELPAGPAPAAAAPAAPPPASRMGIDGRPAAATESLWAPAAEDRFARFIIPAEEGRQALGPDDCGLVRVGPGGRLEVVGGGESASPAPVATCPEDRPCVDAGFAVDQLARVGLAEAPVYLDPAPDTPWEDVAALAGALACRGRHQPRKVILGPTDQARYDRAFGSGQAAVQRAGGMLDLLRGGDGGGLSSALGSLDGEGVGGLGGLGCRDCLTGRGLGTGRLGKQPVVQAGGPLLTGPLPKEIIRRVIKQHQAQVRYCYEKELLRDPKLEGKLKVKFVIGPEGQVSRAEIVDDELKSPAVAGCVQKVFQRLRFPAPKGGGVVNVTYPLVFKSAQ
ncbi:MAG TPA: AgmX/PglI C-terminal domain-containing protein [Myxococcota bacterium]|nr:AgmX/PglI C-terminal domain-containing protein [Myxococcota bacterium]HRY94594.1 AgmX/PglI C-terminal domain-containing protein [Myxococcota bacterium]HSA20324.1 AgmX/PglI C-terminal domain-containing protein [Myxococcota bacterium]